MSTREEGPEICSLDDLKVELAAEVHEYLAACLCRGAGHHQDDDESKSAASLHLDRVLIALKMPPSTSICRVNLIRSSPEEVMTALQKEVARWQHTGDNDENVPRYSDDLVHLHSIFRDVVCIDSPKRTGGMSLAHCSKPRVDRDGSSTSCESLFVSWPSRDQQGWPMSHRVVLCDRFCGEAVLRGSDIFVRGILTADQGIKKGDTVAVYADVRPANVRPITRGLSLQRYNGRCVFLGLGEACCSRSEFFSLSSGLGVKMSSRSQDRVGPALPPLSGVLSGKYMLQNLPSVLVGHALDPRKNDVILDMCSAPGGKTSHVASLVNNRATIIACDKSRKKMVSTRAFFAEMGASCIVPLAWDSTKCVIREECQTLRRSVQEIISSASASEKDGLLNIKAFYPESFDRIILDPPCSALGLRPKLQIDATAVTDLEKHVRYQRLFVREAVSLLKPGGTMTFSTCTIHAAENEGMVRYILDEHSNMSLVPIDVDFGLPGLPGFGLSEAEQQCVRRFDPSDVACDTMGFFVAKFVKKL